MEKSKRAIGYRAYIIIALHFKDINGKRRPVVKQPAAFLTGTRLIYLLNSFL